MTKEDNNNLIYLKTDNSKEVKNTNIKRMELDFYFDNINDLIYSDFNRLGGGFQLDVEDEFKDFLELDAEGLRETSAWYIRWFKFLPDGFNWDSDEDWNKLELKVQFDFMYEFHRECILHQYDNS